MIKPKRILITGITGFIGSALSEYLLQLGHEVWGLSSHYSNGKSILQCDLMSLDSTKQVVSQIPPCSVIIHAAALAHDTKKVKSIDYLLTNKTITKNLLNVLEYTHPHSHFIFLSSVSVYGNDQQTGEISVSDQLKPSTPYGISKLACEQLVQSTQLSSYSILRLAPVFDETNQVELKKRVYFPGQTWFKLFIKPSPYYSFCHLNTLQKKVVELLEENHSSPKVFNVVDAQPYNQNKLAKRFFGIFLPIPVIFVMPFYYFSFLMGKKRGYQFRCLFWKLFKNNIYV